MQCHIELVSYAALLPCCTVPDRVESYSLQSELRSLSGCNGIPAPPLRKGADVVLASHASSPKRCQSQTKNQ